MDTNNLTGVIPALPQTLNNLQLGYPDDSKFNNFTGSLLLNQPLYLYINNNLISDLIVYDPSLLANNCDLSNNPLLGNPHIMNLTMCIQTGLYASQSLTVESMRTRHIRMHSITSSAFTFSSIHLSQSSSQSTGNLLNNVALITTGNAIAAHIYLLKITWRTALRVAIDILLLILVIIKTPIAREIRKLRKKPVHEISFF